MDPSKGRNKVIPGTSFLISYRRRWTPSTFWCETLSHIRSYSDSPCFTVAAISDCRMAMGLSSRGALRRKGWCSFFKIFFFVFQLLLLLLLFQFTFSGDPKAEPNKYPTFREAKDHFLNSIGSFSVMKSADPGVASRNYQRVSKLSKRDKRFLFYFIDDYIVFHKRHRYNATRRLIFTPLRTGIGDRMGCLMFAYWASVLSKRVLLVNWQYPFPLQDFLQEANGLKIFLKEGQFDEEAKLGKVAMLNYTQSSLDRYEEVFASDANTVIMATNKLPGRFSESGVAKLIPSDMSPAHVNTMRLDRNFQRAILHHVLTLSERMKSDHETLTSQMGLSYETAEERKRPVSRKDWIMHPFFRPRRPYIAVHARIGTGVGENTADRFKNISENVKTAASCLASRAVRLALLGGGPGLPLYLATDTPRFRDIFEVVVHSFSNGRIDVMSGNWSVEHSNKLPANSDKQARGDNWESMWGSYMDLIMLGHGEHILALYSSFPRLALALGNAETLTEFRNHICFSK